MITAAAASAVTIITAAAALVVAIRILCLRVGRLVSPLKRVGRSDQRELAALSLLAK